MELLLNLAWLLLALPAYYLWRNSTSALAKRRFSSLQAILALGCLLIVLFPVVSATDDLHVMRAEMEESPASKRSIRQASTEKPAFSHSHYQSFLVLNSSPLLISAEAWNQIPLYRSSAPSDAFIRKTGRAPPASALA
jgi:hypothetical protein